MSVASLPGLPDRKSRNPHRENPPLQPFYWFMSCASSGAKGRHIGIMIQVTETTPFFLQSTGMNQALLISSVRQHELTEEGGEAERELQPGNDYLKQFALRQPRSPGAITHDHDLFTAPGQRLRANSTARLRSVWISYEGRQADADATRRPASYTDGRRGAGGSG